MAEKLPFLRARMALIRGIRGYFDEQGFDEVDSPILQITPCMDIHIHGFKTTLMGIDLKPERDVYLHTSPEFPMKKLLVAGLPKIYQLCKVFRNGEGSKLHSAEFTMIEWYRANAGYMDILNDCVDLLQHCARTLDITEYNYGGLTCDPFADAEILSVKDAFQNYAGVNLDDVLDDRDALAAHAKRLNIHVAGIDEWDDLFLRICSIKIEPFLGVGRPTFLIDYPASLAFLARRKADDPRYAERFELYMCGVELANAYGELTDASEQRKRFVDDMKTKQRIYSESYPLDEDFLKALEHGMPPSGGIALGVDRLAMLATNANNIDQVLWVGKP